ncbi:MAG: hypothetical protein Q7U61_13100 [Zwartia sp.]|nr:hypothetical protein [Zwartia sp.]
MTDVGSGHARTSLRPPHSHRTTPKLAPLGLRQGRCVPDACTLISAAQTVMDKIKLRAS